MNTNRMEALLNYWLWQEEYWLPPGISWQDTEMEQGEGHFPLPRDLIYTLPLAVVFIVLRYVFERIIAIPFSKCLGVKDRVRIRATSVPKLETFYKHNSRQPSQPVADVHYWYYMLEMSFYLSLLLSISVDVKRKDFKEQVIHHIATLFLISFSYCANYVRVGTLVMLVHDSSDFILESAKMLHYAVWTRTCDSLFIVFAVVFLVTRLVVFPSRIIHTTMVVSMDFFQPFFGYYFFNALLLVLQALHVFWAYLIVRMAFKFAFMGKVEKDERSDAESEVDENEEEEEDEESEEERDGSNWEQQKERINSKRTSLAKNCVLNNLTNQRNISSRLPKAR
ncbi:ceramide synthase 2 isoform X2 [Nothobranchius furzeri]|uniref:ceramide synthase 2 isoform X2 n=1 Tax=Nothobranchius furzeri TaxID=105023 RepID=UPI003904902B